MKLLQLIAIFAFFSTFASAQAADVVRAPKAVEPPDGFILVVDEPAVVNQVFRAEMADKTFETTLVRWAKQAGWSVSWELGSEYSIGYAGEFGTDFVRAVDSLCASLNSSGVRARSRVYLDNKVVRVVLEGAQ